MDVSRRTLVKAAGVVALASPAATTAGGMPPNKFEGPDTPTVGLSLGDGGSLGGRGAAPADAQKAQETAARRLKQLGVNWVLLNGGPYPGRNLLSKDRSNASNPTASPWAT